MVRCILAAWYLVGQDSGYPGPPINIQANVQGDHKTNVRAVARDGIVLLKSTGSVLLLKKPTKLALVGSAATVHPSGANASDRTTLSVSSSDSTDNLATMVSGADAAIVVITSDSGEGYITVEGNAGAETILILGGNALVQAVAAANKNTIVVIQSVGQVILESILALDGIKAVVWAGLGSQESGNALADILLYGSTSPSGKLSYTIANSATDYETAIASGDDSFPEGLYIDCRHFDHANIAPRYEFGFGLSYTNFTYSKLSVTSTVASGPAAGPVAPGGRSDLFQQVATVTATITNAGSVAGAEVPQLYLTLPSGAPAAPPKQLRGSAKLLLQPGASGVATFNLRRQDRLAKGMHL
ncbi:hypothetical protein diail_11837 [Diaporthe ilicicola]|nr:hypothetical protein diail_11837 [Diaporthe ilicicola]